MHTPPGVTIDTPVNLREVGRLRVLEALHATPRSSRPELVRVTGLSRATVSSLVADLIAVGLVTEEEPDTDDPEPRRTGRPAQSLSLVPTAGYAIGADIGHQHVRVNLCDLFGTVLWEHWVAKDVDRAPEETLDLVAVLVGRALQETGVARSRVLGIGSRHRLPGREGQRRTRRRGHHARLGRPAPHRRAEEAHRAPGPRHQRREQPAPWPS